MSLFDQIYQAEYDALPDATAELEKQKAAALNTLKGTYDTSSGTLKDTLRDQIRNAYVESMMQKRDLPALLSMQGLTGGITETAANDITRDYRNTTGAANKAYNTSFTDLTNSYNTNAASVESDYGSRIIDALANRRAEALQKAQIAYQIRQAEAAAAQPSVAAAAESSGPIVETENKTIPTWKETGGVQKYQAPYYKQPQSTFGYKNNQAKGGLGAKGSTGAFVWQ